MPLAMVIDDSKAIRLILARVLDSLGFSVREAANGLEALGLLMLDPGYQLALVDWNMPGLTGIEFVRAVRAKPEFAGLKLVMVTTETSLQQMSQALEAGADEYVMKPFTRDVIEGKLRILHLVPDELPVGVLSC